MATKQIHISQLVRQQHRQMKQIKIAYKVVRALVENPTIMLTGARAEALHRVATIGATDQWHINRAATQPRAGAGK